MHHTYGVTILICTKDSHDQKCYNVREELVLYEEWFMTPPSIGNWTGSSAWRSLNDNNDKAVVNRLRKMNRGFLNGGFT